MGFLNDALGGHDDFQAQAAPITKQDFSGALSQSAGQFNQAYNGQTSLAQQLQAQSQGLGPNPAQMMLHQATDRNIQQNAGFTASQKGINPALAQRMAAQNQANMSQQAAGQGALMGAQQQLTAQQQLAGVYNSQANQGLGMNQNLQNAQASQNNAIVGNTNSMNATNAQTSAANTAASAAIIGGALGAGGAAMTGGGSAAKGKAHGGKIEGRAPVPGDSPANDVVPTMLSPGEIVIPRSVANDPKKALAFIEAINKKKETSEDGPSFAHILKKHRELGEALKKHGAA